MGLHAEIFVSVVNSREEIKDKQLPTEQPATIFEWFVNSTTVYLSATEIPGPGTSTTFCMSTECRKHMVLG